MIMMTNLAIHTIVVPFQTTVPHLTKFLSKSHRVIYKKKKKSTKRKDKNTFIKEKDETIKERARTNNLDVHKYRYYHQP